MQIDVIRLVQKMQKDIKHEFNFNEVVCKGAKIRNSCLTVIVRNGNSKKV